MVDMVRVVAVVVRVDQGHDGAAAERADAFLDAAPLADQHHRVDDDDALVGGEDADVAAHPGEHEHPGADLGDVEHAGAPPQCAPAHHDDEEHEYQQTPRGSPDHEGCV
jgi:hypothetical protein